jgi:hypothetical protein
VGETQTLYRGKNQMTQNYFLIFYDKTTFNPHDYYVVDSNL